MKKLLSITLAILMVTAFAFFAIGSGSEDTDDQGSSSAKSDSSKADTNLGDYNVTIDNCTLSKNTLDKKDVAIISYTFTNKSDSAQSFDVAFSDKVYQDGVEMERNYFCEDESFNLDASSKEIKAGKSVKVDIAYTLNDTTTDVDVEVSELISLDDNVVKKTFTIK
jgi:hypothetical protein